MTTEDGNKLIAEFMGAKLKHYNISNAPYYLMPNKQQWMPERLVYHTSWDWLMPVVEKISKIKANWNDAEIHDTYYPRTFGMLSESGKTMVRINAHQVFEADTLIEAAWLAVVDFIEWSIKATNVKRSVASNDAQ